MDREGYTRLPHRGNDNCFACSPENPAGLKMQFFTNGEKIVSRLKVPSHLSGWDNLVHGGIITTMLDEAMGWAALHLLKKMTLTKSVSVEFIRPAYVEQDLRVEARASEIRGEREATMESLLYNTENELCARASGTFALFTIEAMKQRGIVSERILEGVERLIKE